MTSNNTPLVSTSPSSTSGVAIGAPHTVGGGAAVATQLVDPSLLASMQVGAGGVNNVNGVNLSPSSNNNNNVCSASPPPNSKAFHTIEVRHRDSSSRLSKSSVSRHFDSRSNPRELQKTFIKLMLPMYFYICCFPDETMKVAFQFFFIIMHYLVWALVQAFTDNR